MLALIAFVGTAGMQTLASGVNSAFSKIGVYTERYISKVVYSWRPALLLELRGVALRSLGEAGGLCVPSPAPTLEHVRNR